MADLILKTSAGKIWVNGTGKVLKAKKFSQIPIQDGLEFWGQADPTLLTQIDGLVSEAYDVRDGYGGARKMIQNTVINRPEFINNMIGNGASASKRLVITGQSARSMFIVMIPSNYFCGLGNSYSIPYVGRGVTKLGLLTSSIFTYNSFVNNVKYSNGYVFSDSSLIYIISSLDPVNSYSTMYLGDLADANGCKVKEWGWYNRLLSETEVIYNINCLNQKYAIF